MEYDKNRSKLFYMLKRKYIYILDEIGSVLADAGYKMTTVLERRSGPEFLSILKFAKQC